ncbi:MAG: hypothetical protein ACOH1M_09630 [Rhodoglobus sp.]
MNTSQRALKSAITLVIAAGVTVSVAGCFSNPLEDLANGLVENTVENVIEGSTGVDVDVNSDGKGGSLPASWPAEVPVPDGEIALSLSVGGSYNVTVVVGSQDAAEAGYEKFLDNGFEVVSEFSLGEGVYAYGLQSDKWTVQYSWGEDDEGSSTVNITATPAAE